MGSPECFHPLRCGRTFGNPLVVATSLQSDRVGEGHENYKDEKESSVTFQGHRTIDHCFTLFLFLEAELYLFAGMHGSRPVRF
jgi:hypothetical protein